MAEGCDAEAWHGSRMDGASLSEVHNTIFWQFNCRVSDESGLVQAGRLHC